MSNDNYLEPVPEEDDQTPPRRVIQIIDADLDTAEKIEAYLRAIYGPPASERTG